MGTMVPTGVDEDSWLHTIYCHIAMPINGVCMYIMSQRVFSVSTFHHVQNLYTCWKKCSNAVHKYYEEATSEICLTQYYFFYY